MLGEIFYWVFNMSIAAAICGIALLLLRCIRNFPRRFMVLLWLIPFTRMCVPIGLTGRYGLMSFLSQFTTKSVTIYELGDNSVFTMMNHTMGANSYFPITYKVDILEDVFSVAAFVWIIGTTALMIAFSIIYFVTVGEMKGAAQLKDNIYLSDKIKVPAVYGIISPKIVIPYEYKERQLDYILKHEKAHIRRRDNLFRVLAFLTVCVHWFNPLCWLFLKLLYSDMELACDEAVLSKCNESQKKEYAHALVSSVEKTNVFAASFGGANIRIRIENILSYKKLTAVSVTGFTALIIVIAYVLLTNAI